MTYNLATIPHEPTFGDDHYLVITTKADKKGSRSKSVVRIMNLTLKERNFHGGRFEKFDETLSANFVEMTCDPFGIDKMVTWVSAHVIGKWRFNVSRHDINVWHFFFQKTQDAVYFKLKWLL